MSARERKASVQAVSVGRVIFPETDMCRQERKALMQALSVKGSIRCQKKNIPVHMPVNGCGLWLRDVRPRGI